MNDLERIGLQTLSHQLYEILKRCDVKDENRDWKHMRPFMESDVNKALKTLRAIQDNSPEKL